MLVDRAPPGKRYTWDRKSGGRTRTCGGGYAWSRGGRCHYQRWRHSVRAERSVDLEAARECVDQASGASWWLWDHGSRPFFWSWDPDYVAIIRDGLKWWLQIEPPWWRVAQADVKDPVTKEVIWKKIQKVRQGWYRLDGKRVRGNEYIEPGKVASLTSFFIVKKGNTGKSRVVYNGSASGLNQVL